jgi:hypothetical protein
LCAHVALANVNWSSRPRQRASHIRQLVVGGRGKKPQNERVCCSRSNHMKMPNYVTSSSSWVRAVYSSIHRRALPIQRTQFTSRSSALYRPLNHARKWDGLSPPPSPLPHSLTHSLAAATRSFPHLFSPPRHLPRGGGVVVVVRRRPVVGGCFAGAGG